MNLKQKKQADLICKVAGACAYEVMRDIQKRNRLAQELFTNTSWRKVKYTRPNGKTFQVETWWDRYSRNYITMHLDDKGHDYAEDKHNHTTGHKDDAAVAHLWALAWLFEFQPIKSKQ